MFLYHGTVCLFPLFVTQRCHSYQSRMLSELIHQISSPKGLWIKEALSVKLGLIGQNLEEVLPLSAESYLRLSVRTALCLFVVCELDLKQSPRAKIGCFFIPVELRLIADDVEAK